LVDISYVTTFKQQFSFTLYVEQGFSNGALGPHWGPQSGSLGAQAGAITR